MSNSYKNVPIIGFACYRSMKPFRVSENRSFRRTTKQHIKASKFNNLPQMRAYQNEWNSPRDGQQYIGDMRTRSCHHYNRFIGWVTCRNERHIGCSKMYKRLMRK